ncbi:MAG: DUF983 domain-containing protein [Asticcacaulis sp.]
MSDPTSVPPASPAAVSVSMSQAITRGLTRKCPCCGTGRMFKGYLRVVDTCDVCETPLSIYPADDGPAYLTILLVGHLVVAPLLAFDFIWKMDPLAVLGLTLVPITVLTLAWLPFIKGGFIGLLWRNGIRRGQ